VSLIIFGTLTSNSIEQKILSLNLQLMGRVQVQIVAIAVGLAGLSGCIMPEQPSSEADIIAFALPGIACVENNVNANTVYIKVENKDWAALSGVSPLIEVSQGATITPPSGVAVDLAAVQYAVTSESGQSSKIYTISLAQEYSNDTVFFPFESWKTTGDGYNTPTDADWSSGNAGISMGLSALGIERIPGNYPSQMTTEGKQGNAVKLETKLGGLIVLVNVPVWSGNFFLGNFNTGKALSSPLEATEFGRIYKRKPKAIQGYYKYREGSGKYSLNGEEVDRADSCSIYAVFYRADGDATLTAYDIGASPLALARADLADGSPTDGDGFHEFCIEFGQYSEEPDFENHRYKLTIVFSSSARGATAKYENGQPTKTAIYAGKVGSTLIVDEVRVINY
jgi:hypothetical protein